MTEQQIAAVKQALDWFTCYLDKSMSRNNAETLAVEVAGALRRILADHALDKMAENARELGLDYD